jgi:bacterioferritin-associated ferredoxin
MKDSDIQHIKNVIDAMVVDIKKIKNILESKNNSGDCNEVLAKVLERLESRLNLGNGRTIAILHEVFNRRLSTLLPSIASRISKPLKCHASKLVEGHRMFSNSLSLYFNNLLFIFIYQDTHFFKTREYS